MSVTGKDPPAAPEILLYQSEDGRTRLEVRFDGDTAWLTQAAMADLFQTTPQKHHAARRVHLRGGRARRGGNL